MAYSVANFIDNDDVSVVEEGGCFTIIQYDRDLSCAPSEAELKYYMSLMGVTKKQLVCDLQDSGIVLQKGAMQWVLGNVEQTSGFKGVGDIIGKAFTSKVTGEDATKPEYKGTGIVVTEPTYKYMILENLADWGGAIVIEDGLFLACDLSIKMDVVMRQNISSATLGKEGLFNLCLNGKGYAVLETMVPREELITIDLKDDTIRIDGNYAIAWSRSLNFTVEKSGKSLLGSAVSGEGLVNVYRGTGKILMMPQV